MPYVGIYGVYFRLQAYRPSLFKIFHNAVCLAVEIISVGALLPYREVSAGALHETAVAIRPETRRADLDTRIVTQVVGRLALRLAL